MISIREVGKESAQMLSDIHRASFPNYWKAEAFSDFFSVAGTFALLAEAEKPVGMMVTRITVPEAEILTLAVLPEWRKQGIGADLLAKSMEKAANFGSKRMFLDVEEGNSAALRLYEAHGFALIRRRKQYYRQKDGAFTDALVMGRKLP